LEKREYDPFEEPQRWRDWLAEQTKGTYQVFSPEMPNKYNASYKAWKIRFEKIFPYLNDEDLILIGHSL
jgi:predicted alpha/beta hydrolase family esterase